MKLLQNILVSTDFSESSEKALEVAISVAKLFNSQITVLHVSTIENLPKETESFLRQTTNEKLQQIRAKIIAEKVTFNEIIIEKGVPFEKIIQISQTKDINIIIVGSGTKTKNDTFKLGTTVEKLMRKNQVPVWVVKNEDVKPVKKIICPVDFSPASKRALSNAIIFTERFNAELQILNVVVPITNSSPRFIIDTETENTSLMQTQREQLDDFLKEFNLKSISYNVKILMGDPFIEIINSIRLNQSDLLFMGTTGKSELSRILMGSVTEKVTRELLCSFITTKAMNITDDYLDNYLEGLESIINPAKEFLKNGEIDKAVEKFTIALKQYPDNIPAIIGLIKTHTALGNEQKVSFYKGYAQKVITRIWGEEYLKIIELP